jgi:ammonia channel protein AmtB
LADLLPGTAHSVLRRLRATTGLRAGSEAGHARLDLTSHGERAYDFTQG